MEAYLPTALLHLREGEIVRVCGLARAARGQEAARVGRVQQPERSGGTLRATMLDGEMAGHVLARFSDAGLDFWECTFHPHTAPPDVTETAQPLLPCEHLAALLALWVRHPEQFRAPDTRSSAISGAPPSRHIAQEAPPVQPDQAAPVPAGNDRPPFAPRPLQSRFEQLEPQERRFLETLALAGGRMTESEVSRVFARLGLGAPEELVVLLNYLSVSGWVQPLYTGRRPVARGIPAQSVGWHMPDEALALFPRIMPLQPLLDAPAEEAATDAAFPAETALHIQPAVDALPALLFGVVAQAANRVAADTDGDAAPTNAGHAEQAAPHFLAGSDWVSEQAGRWAQVPGATPEQIRFCNLLARLLGLAAPVQTADSGAARGARGAATLAGRAQDATARDTPAQLSHEQAADLLLRAYRLLLGRDGMEALRDIALHWLHAHSAHELRELRDAGARVAALYQRDARRAPDIAAENQAAREQIIDLLRFVPAGRWWSFTSLIEFLWAFRPDFLRGRQQTFLRPQWWLERLEDGRALSLDVRADWRQAEGRYLALLFRRALHWLGMVDLALDERGRLKGFRITPAGAFVLNALGSDGQAVVLAKTEATPLAADISTPAQAIAACSWSALDDGRLVVSLAGLDEPTLALLLRWCEPGGASTNDLVFWPTAERAAAALDAGHDLEIWLAWLGQRDQTEPLSVVIAQSRCWAGMYGRVRLYESVALLEVADPALMRELEAAVALSAQYLDHALSSGLAVVRSDALESLLEALRKRGYAPWDMTHEIANRP